MRERYFEGDHGEVEEVEGCLEANLYAGGVKSFRTIFLMQCKS